MSSRQQQLAAAAAAVAGAKKRAPKERSNTGIVAFALVVSSAFFSIPFVMHWSKVRNAIQCLALAHKRMRRDNWRVRSH